MSDFAKKSLAFADDVAVRREILNALAAVCEAELAFVAVLQRLAPGVPIMAAEMNCAEARCRASGSSYVELSLEIRRFGFQESDRGGAELVASANAMERRGRDLIAYADRLKTITGTGDG